MTMSSLVEPGALVREQQTALAEELVSRQCAAHPELTLRDGRAGREKHLREANDHLAHLADAMSAGAPALFADYVGWATVMLGKRGVAVDVLVRSLELMRQVVGESLGGEARTMALAYLDTGLARAPLVAPDLPSCLPSGAPYGQLARAYLDTLLAGDRHLASTMILHAVATHVPVGDIYEHVFQPALHEVGRLWQLNEISVAQEHYCTAATQLVMSQLYPHIFASEKGAGTLVATCVAGDLHEIGLRMVADFFEMAGWNTFYLGANMPAAAVVETVVQRRATVLVISATISLHLRAVGELIRRVRAHPECARVRILVGGHPFAVAPDLWQTLGADGSATNAREAILLAQRLVAA